MGPADLAHLQNTAVTTTSMDSKVSPRYVTIATQYVHVQRTEFCARTCTCTLHVYTVHTWVKLVHVSEKIESNNKECRNVFD